MTDPAFTIEIRVRGTAEELGIEQHVLDQALARATLLLPDAYAVTALVESAPAPRTGVGEHEYTPEHVLRQKRSLYGRTGDEVCTTLEEIGLGAEELAGMTAGEVEEWVHREHVDWMLETVGDEFGWAIEDPS